MKMIKMLALALCLSACGSVEEKKTDKPVELSTGALTMESLNLSPSTITRENVCEEATTFFRAYASLKFPALETAVSCEAIGKEQEVWTQDEMSRFISAPTICAEGRICYKAHFTVRKGGRSDEFIGLIAVFDSGKSSGLLIDAYDNKSYLPLGSSKIHAGELLDDGLANLRQTFNAWLVTRNP